MTQLELLAPAKNYETAVTAINAGADAVYIGASHHGARSEASNSTDDIRRLCDFAHKFRVKVYVTLNTLIYENELDDVRQLVCDLYASGVDALIVQDMALLEMDIPPIELHASTQCDTRTPEKALFLQKAGFSQIVLPREMTLDEIKEVRKVTDVPLEGFVHGALCVSYSGACRASFVNGGRSANRGECAQICRLPYTLVDGDNKIIAEDKHFLSLKDMNRIDQLAAMAEAGISSFKIEGRLKSANYVRNVTSAYSDALNELIKIHPDKYCRAAAGKIEKKFIPDLHKTFNREYTPYFLTTPSPGRNELGSHATPKHVGEKIAKVIEASSRKIKIENNSSIVNGDGLGFFDRNGQLIGFRVNRIENSVISLSSPLSSLPIKGTVLYRNYDKDFNDRLARDPQKRFVEVDASLTATPKGIAITVNDERGCSVTVGMETVVEKARTSQKEQRKRTVTKTGDTIYRVKTFNDELPDDVFIRASALTELRRNTFEMLDHAAAATYPVRIKKKRPLQFMTDSNVEHTNVANSLARRFYDRIGVTDAEEAIETISPDQLSNQIEVMTTRYCLRRELGACLRTPDGKRLKEPLKLLSKNGRTIPMRVDFDCKNCKMHLIALK